MSSVATHVSPEEYLERERQAENKNEYRNGEIVAMSGASRWHMRIVTNLIAVLDHTLLNPAVIIEVLSKSTAKYVVAKSSRALKASITDGISHRRTR